ncbi:hypothetical protein [Lusitaniella coriacea]
MVSPKTIVLRLVCAIAFIGLIADTYPHPELAPGVLSSTMQRFSSVKRI